MMGLSAMVFEILPLKLYPLYFPHAVLCSKVIPQRALPSAFSSPTFCSTVAYNHHHSSVGLSALLLFAYSDKRHQSDEAVVPCGIKLSLVWPGSSWARGASSFGELSCCWHLLPELSAAKQPRTRLWHQSPRFKGWSFAFRLPVLYVKRKISSIVL